MEYEEAIKTDEFQNTFWKWFDELDSVSKQRFWYYSSDLAKFYYFNRVFKYENLHRTA
jgi:hypothetical protein